MAERLNKRDALQHWAELKPAERIPIRAIPYKQTGSKYGTDGIRIDGTRQFIDSVLSRMRDLLVNENGDTRLELNYTEITDRETGHDTGNWVCYVRLHERGREAQAMNALFGKVKK